MAEFNAELYLRMLGEKMVVMHAHRSGLRVGGDLLEAASALVSCDLLDAAAARPVLNGYASAFAVRNMPGMAGGFPAPRSDPQPNPRPIQLAPRRVYALDATITSPRGLGRLRLRWISLSDHHIRLGLSATVDAPANVLTSGLPGVEVITPDGQRIETTFVGHWSGGEVHGSFGALARVSADTTWLAIDGTRVELGRSTPGGEVAVQEVHPDNPAVAHVWQLLSDFTDLRSDPSTGEAALAALVTAGLISPEDPALEAVAWVKNRSSPGRLPWTAGRPATVTSDPPVTVPEEWRGLANGRTGTFVGAERTLPVGVVTPVFDGVCVALDTLISEAHSLTVELEMSSAEVSHGDPVRLKRNPVSIWARDDRHNYYIGHAYEWSAVDAAESVYGGSVEFAALDPAARALTVIPQTARAQALIRIPL